MKRKIDWPQVAALAVVLAAVIAALVLVDVEKAQAWLVLVPTIASAVGAFYAASRGRAVETVPHPGTVDSSRSRAERRERGTMPPPAALVLLAASCLPMAACTPAQKAAFEGAVLSALELAAKAAGRVLLDEAERALKFGDAGGEEP